MEQRSIDKYLEDLEEWYAQYTTQKDPIALPDLQDPESLDPPDQSEAETLQLMSDIDVTDGFCSICHTMLNNWPDLEPRGEGQVATNDGSNGPRVYPYSPSIDLSPGVWIEYDEDVKCVLACQGQIVRLDAATRKGCRFCGLALQELKRRDWLELYRLIERRLHRLGKPSAIPLVAYTWRDRARAFDVVELGFPGRLFHEDASYKPPRLFAFCDGKYSNEVSQPFRFTSSQASTSQSSLMQLANRWTSSCLESHPDCNLERSRCYPSRLLSIAVDPIRLVVTAQWTDRPLYATLSHCWGIAKFETLEKENIDELKRGVPARFLSKTFIDAIQIARAVGLTYLWIDSLCIIQDSKKDWEAEASMMASVYGGSSLNIAASSAKDGSEGCFLEPLNHAGGFTTRVYTDEKTEILEFVSGDEYYETVTNCHLATRGWTVQEKVLPPRTLHCGNKGFFWECRTRIASEYFPDGFSETNFFLRDDSVRWDDSDLMEYWERIKRWYASCHLTNAGDKLVALSGVARAIQNETGDQYFAGLWRRTLAQELCWMATDPRQRLQYRAPSWSWTAVDGSVLFTSVGREDIASPTYYAHVRSVSVIHPGGTTLGAVLHGTLSLHCDVIFCGTIIPKEIARGKRSVCPMHTRRNDDQEAGTCFSTLGQTGHMLPFSLDYVEQKDSRVDQTIFYLPLRVVGPPRSPGEDRGAYGVYEQAFGLVLECIDAVLHQYRRIGSFRYFSSGSWVGHDDNSECSLTKDYAKFMELVPAASSSGCGGLTINIV